MTTFLKNKIADLPNFFLELLNKIKQNPKKRYMLLDLCEIENSIKLKYLE